MAFTVIDHDKYTKNISCSFFYIFERIAVCSPIGNCTKDYGTLAGA